MARYQYVILSQAKPGREEEFIRWYREQHLVDVARQPGVITAKLFAPDIQKVYDLDAPRWNLITIYEIESDDPAATMEAIRLQAGSAGMPMSDALDKTGMVQLVAHQIAAVS